MISIKDITKIEKNKDAPGYSIFFRDRRKILITKKRTIPALLLLIQYTDGCEADLQKGSERLPEIKKMLSGKIPDDLIQDYYADANKPFSELWNEEGFVWITNTKGDRRLGSQRYYLDSNDHDKLFRKDVRKAYRRSLSTKEKEYIRKKQSGKCNICKSQIYPVSKIPRNTFSRDRVREVFDHRVPVEKDGTSDLDNFQGLCFYCNKSKWQICNVCSAIMCKKCVLAYPEREEIITPTDEDISDRM